MYAKCMCNIYAVKYSCHFFFITTNFHSWYILAFGLEQMFMKWGTIIIILYSAYDNNNDALCCCFLNMSLDIIYG